MKIDIVDLMDFYWNDAPVPDAPEEMGELLKQRGTWVPRREAGHRRNRPLLAAAVVLLAVLVVMPFVLSRTVGDPAAASAEDAQTAEVSDNDQTVDLAGDPDAASKENAQSAEAFGEDQTAHSVGTLLSSAVYPVALEVPTEYSAEIEVDTPYQDNPYGTLECEIQFDNVVFSFYDKSSHAYGLIGLVWCITATPINEYTPPDPMYYDFIFEYNEAELGTDEDYVYTLIYPSVLHQCNPDDPENADSYFAHLAIGQDLLTQFIQQNSLQSDGAGLERYAAYLASEKERVQ